MSEGQTRLGRWRDQASDFLERRVWVQPLPPFFSLNGLIFRFLRTLDLVVRGFREDQLRLHASALTYATLVSLVPIVALTLAILKGLGYDDQLQLLIAGQSEQLPQQFQKILSDLLRAVSEANFAKIGGVGGLVLFFTVVQMLSRIERSFNRIWLVTRDRAFLRRITNYISILTVVPLLLVTAVGVTARMRLVPDLHWGQLRLAPFLATWTAFAFLYGAMPNIKVRPVPALVSGLLGAGLWHLWFWFYITVQPGVTRFNIIYGTLASVPFFLVWLFFSWVIVLLGAKISYAVQNGNTLRPSESVDTDVRTQTVIALAVLRRCLAAFRGQGPAFDEEHFAGQARLKPEIVSGVVDMLRDAGLVVADKDADDGTFVLGRDPAAITVADILHLVMAQGENAHDLQADLTSGPEWVALADLMDRLKGETQTLAQLGTPERVPN